MLDKPRMVGQRLWMVNGLADSDFQVSWGRLNSDTVQGRVGTEFSPRLHSNFFRMFQIYLLFFK